MFLLPKAYTLCRIKVIKWKNAVNLFESDKHIKWQKNMFQIIRKSMCGFPSENRINRVDWPLNETDSSFAWQKGILQTGKRQKWYNVFT